MTASETGLAPLTLNQRWSATAIGALVACGVKHLVICPGSRSTPLALAAVERSDLTTFVVLDERAAAFFALGLAKASQAPAAVLCTSGTAGAHFLPAAIEATVGGTPLVLLTADRPAELHGFGAPQTIEQKSLFGTYVHSAVHFEAPEEIAARFEHLVGTLADALDLSRAAGTGAVHFNFAFREPLAPPDSRAAPPVTISVPRRAARVLSPDIDEVVSLIDNAKSGAIVVGPMPPGQEQRVTLEALSEHLSFPLLSEAASNVRFGSTRAIWAYDSVLRAPSWAHSLLPDVVLRFGGALTGKHLQAFVDGASGSVVLCHPQGKRIDPQLKSTHIIHAEAAQLAKLLTQKTRRVKRNDSRWYEAQSTVGRCFESLDNVWDEPSIARAVIRSVPDNANVLLSSSMPIRDVDAFAASGTKALRVFCNRGVNGIDGLVSTSVGIASTNVEVPTVALLGDLASLHDLSGFLIAKNQRPNLVLVVVNNNGGGIFSFLPIAQKTSHFHRLFTTAQNVDFESVAAFSSATFRRVRSVGELEHAVTQACTGGWHLIEAVVDGTTNVEAHQHRYAQVAKLLGEAP
jgi:2-succinyl-5-enolpyruvyl-6-hydroxy-3-cyclohexene-1-carboxylate synthase